MAFDCSACKRANSAGSMGPRWPASQRKSGSSRQRLHSVRTSVSAAAAAGLSRKECSRICEKQINKYRDGTAGQGPAGWQSVQIEKEYEN